MKTHHSQNLTSPGGLPGCTLDEAMRSAGGGRDSWLERVFHGLHDQVTDYLRKQSAEFEIYSAIEHLERLSDEQLRDMGITRMDIPRVVRYGKDGI